MPLRSAASLFLRPLCVRPSAVLPARQRALVRSYKVVSRHITDPPPNTLPNAGETAPPPEQATMSPSNAFTELNVLASVPTPGSAVEIVYEDGFLLSNGIRWRDGSGAFLIQNEVFKWRPAERGSGLERNALKTGTLELPDAVWGMLEVIHPKPELLIIGTGKRTLMLSKKDRGRLTELGIRMDVMDTSHAAAQYNLLCTERSSSEISAALLAYEFGTPE